tara:strand:- start:152 stop:532 length:381 start_codon:yes stop_codon:yes gene_type:complete
MKKTAVNLAAIATYTFLLAWCSLSPGGTSELWFAHFDKILHMGAYAAFALICAPIWWRSENTLVATFIILILLFLFGGTIELGQMLVPRREASWQDILANTLGLIIGWQASNIIKKARKMRAFIAE